MAYPHKLDEDRILEEAARLVDEHGLVALSTRVLADHLDARAPSLYRYFPDKECLIRALCARFLGDLIRELEPHDTLAGMASAYWSYAVRHPHRYEAIFRWLPDEERASTQRDIAALEPLVVMADRISPESAAETARAIWSYLHGAASLRLTMPANERDETVAFRLGLHAFEFALGSARTSGEE